jgi:hypothetical protein
MKQFSSHWKCEVFAAMCAASLALGCRAPAVASDDHDRARQALEAGEVLPLRTILERVEREYPGQVVDVELERDARTARNAGSTSSRCCAAAVPSLNSRSMRATEPSLEKGGPGERERDQQKLATAERETDAHPDC